MSFYKRLIFYQNLNVFGYFIFKTKIKNQLKIFSVYITKVLFLGKYITTQHMCYYSLVDLQSLTR